MAEENRDGSHHASLQDDGASVSSGTDTPQLSAEEVSEFRAWQATQRRAPEGPEALGLATGAQAETASSVTGPRSWPWRRQWLLAGVALTGLVAVSLVIYARVSSSLPDFASVSNDCENQLTLLQSSQITGADEYFKDDGSAEVSALLDSAVEYIVVADDGSALTVDSRSFPYLDPDIAHDLDSQAKRDATLEKIESWNLIRDVNSLAVVACVNDQLKLPDALQDRMNSTRALDGTQSAEYGDLIVRWKFHPDDGLSVVYERR